MLHNVFGLIGLNSGCHGNIKLPYLPFSETMRSTAYIFIYMSKLATLQGKQLKGGIGSSSLSLLLKFSS